MWKNGIVDGHWWMAKVYDEPSSYGIKGGRVSKLCISATDHWEGLDNCVYNYDRGLDFNKAPKGLLTKVLKAATEAK
jgi:hypothetical protein